MWVGGAAWLQPDMRGHVSAPKAGENPPVIKQRNGELPLIGWDDYSHTAQQMFLYHLLFRILPTLTCFCDLTFFSVSG